jgi:hypothetical protein
MFMVAQLLEMRGHKCLPMNTAVPNVAPMDLLAALMQIIYQVWNALNA